ncbi:sigma-70 family RNA polymerase sigma factor [Paenibacillus harenae]|uniref:sigma-70 family RNA polymerase sigma factor n=1 Tax=Paenibacillus harenae TaxID=306543 RepID=UPI00041BF775|nr:sigma-70 family RNA polymerase sigma factor [Paenibacillus harenae]
MDIHMEAASDEVLIERARLGSHDAYQELLARHRGRAFQWARQMTPDPHLAEDIVQEALIRAFMKLGTVTDLSKFLPWLRSIVRNQALMKLRRGGPHAHERPFTSLIPQNARASDDGAPDWSDLDTVLHQYAKRGITNTSYEVTLSDSSLAEWLPAVIQCLGPREREVFRKHFYEQLSPQEIAESLDTNVNAIHKALSRIRRKAADTRIELDIQTRIRVHNDSRGGNRTIVLNKPPIQDEPPLYQGIAFPNALYHLLRSMGSSVSMAEVMGYSGYAFNLNVRRTTIGAESPMLWDWDTFLSNALLNLGYHSNYVDYQHFKNAGASTHKTRNFLHALDMIRDSIDRGCPALLTSAMSYDLAIVYGYDDEKQVFYAVDPRACQPVPYRTLYHGSPKIDRAISRELYAYVLEGELDEAYQRPDHKLIRLIERIIRHADGDDYTFIPCSNGLAAYDEWIAAFENGTVDPLGNASNIALYGWSRKLAVKFWEEREHDIWEKTPRIKQFIQRAKICYDAVRRSYEELSVLFPFPHGGLPREEEVRAQAVKLLRQAKEDELEAVEVLRELLTELRFTYLGQGLTPVHHISLNPFYSFGGNRPKPASSQFSTATLEGVICMCGNLKESMKFYGALLGIELEPERLNDPIALLTMRDDIFLVLMDRRLDLNHADWKPVFYIRVPDIDQTYESAIRQKWTIINFLDKGGPFTDFFIAEDADGYQLMIGSHPLAHSFPVARHASNGHPLFLSDAPFTLPVKSVKSAARAYCNIFGEDTLDSLLRFVDKFGPPDTSARLQFEAEDANLAYLRLRHAGIAVSRTLEESEDGINKWVILDPDGRDIVIRTRLS